MRRGALNIEETPEETPDRNLGFFRIVRLNKSRNIAVHTKVTDTTAWPFCHSPEGVPFI